MKILIIDDESLNRFLLLHMLEEEGYTDCYEAKNGQEGIQLAQEVQPDLVLLDVMMPGMDGFAVAPVLKEMAGDNYLPVIFITSLDDKESLARCLEVGGDDFVAKPFDKLILAAKIRAHDRIRQLTSKIEQQNQSLRYFQQSVDREHAIVEHIFNNAIVNKELVTDFFDFSLSPAAVFNGDVFLCESSPAGGLYFLVGDFTGHGLASAIGVLPVSRTFRFLARKGYSAGEIAAQLNTTLGSLLPPDMFCAAAVIEVDASGCRFNIWNGGLPSLLLKSSTNLSMYKVVSRHMALGILESDEFDAECEIIEGEPGDQLLVYTDGLMEVMDEHGKMADEEGVMSWFSSPETITAAFLFERAAEYRADSIQADDTTIVIFSCQSLEVLKEDFATNELPYSIHLTLQGRELNNPHIISSLMEMINSQPGMTLVRSDLYTILSEMFNNALEHGVLKLSSDLKSTPDGFHQYYQRRDTLLANLTEGEIAFKILFKPSESALDITISDSGDGFDVSALDEDCLTACYGRGICFLRELCESVRFSDNGSTLSVRLSMAK
ncbi:fused response regulator/phosphatase [Alteromonas confluentis]|uniref:Response regulatory domain-containing protein n=1 Tax=Alteromonas confluentis TaxID=1656094 RepID=A0A1E7Z7C3_9ALTE|nr:fused response regulator/phosphatase [Alteromonas confluentis]OFC69443.1 hypothetical protein BFC18_18745 [Alteromonas confluentis]